MSSLKSLRAKKSRQSLTIELGGVCFACGCQDSLEFDCIAPRGRQHHLMSWPERIRFYWQEHLHGNLQLLCKRCHLRKTQMDNQKGRGVVSLNSIDFEI